MCWTPQNTSMIFSARTIKSTLVLCQRMMLLSSYESISGKCWKKPWGATSNDLFVYCLLLFLILIRAVVCPTGSGKTAVAVEVDRLLRAGAKRTFKSISLFYYWYCFTKNTSIAVMVVRDLPLSVQQYLYFTKNTRGLRINLLNSENRLLQPWDDMLDMYDVVILTAQILLNNLTNKTAHISKVNLLVSN